MAASACSTRAVRGAARPPSHSPAPAALPRAPLLPRRRLCLGTGSLFLYQFHLFLIVTVIFGILPQPKSLVGATKPRVSFLSLPRSVCVFGVAGAGSHEYGSNKTCLASLVSNSGMIWFPIFLFTPYLKRSRYFPRVFRLHYGF